MKITRFNKIKGHRVFENFTWPDYLPDFARFNLIYGWNGSGKTTISNLLRYVQMKAPILEGDVDFQIDGNNYPGSALATASGLPQIRVFNRDFVEANVFSSMLRIPENSIFVLVDKLKPIFFLGKESVEKQKQVEELTKSRFDEQQKLEAKIKAKTKASKALDDFCIREAKAIKDLLSSGGTNPYNNYDKSHFKAICARLAKLDPPPTPLTEPEKNLLKQQKDSKSKEPITPISVTVPDLDLIRRKNAEMYLQRTVVSQVLEELVTDPSLAEWVDQGLVHHSGKKYDGKCRFCDSPIPEGRIVKLQAHFNDEYKHFLVGLDSASNEISEIQKELISLLLPDKAKFYEHLVSDYEKSVKILDEYIGEATAYLVQIAKALTEKRAKLFEKLDMITFLDSTPLPDTTKATEALKAINGLITCHNTETLNFENVVANARKRLEEGLAAESLVDFTTKSAAIKTIETELQNLQTTTTELAGKILALEKQIVEHRQPAEELNVELRSYLGRDELKFELFESGYQITRHGVSAKNLSEGERTAIAFLYFLKSLQAKDFTIAKDIVVIDDPVSSLDANSLFCAFGYMKARTKGAGQLFILTHSFSFFRQVRNWFHHLRGQEKKETRFYFLETRTLNGKRNASLAELDPLLREFESEYHYLFKKVYDEARRSGNSQPFEEYYHLPNLARRLLESFFAFRFPQESGDLYKQLDKSQCEPAISSRLLRFLDTYSHNQTVGETGHDLSVLAETPDVLKDVIKLIETEDKKHFDEMINLLSTTGS